MKRESIVITGASRGIGKAIADELIKRGEFVIGIARQFNDSNGIHPITCDLSDVVAIPSIVKEIETKCGTPKAIICNAGRGLFGHLEELSIKEITSLFNLNFLSQVALTKAFLPLMKKRGSGDLIYMGSVSGLQGKRKGSIYCASKFALRGFAQALRDECESCGIRVTLINPGMVRTEFFNGHSFCPGDGEEEAIEPNDIAQVVAGVLETRSGTVIDEITLTPKRRVVQKKLRSTTKTSTLGTE